MNVGKIRTRKTPNTDTFLAVYLRYVSIRSILNLTVLGTVQSNIKEVHALLFRISHFRFLVMYRIFSYVLHVWAYSLLINRSGEIEQNPGPKPSSCKTFSICHWNLSSLTIHSYMKTSLLRTYLSLNRLDVLCLFRTFLDSSALSENRNLEIPGRTLVRADHLSNPKSGCACIYYRR